MFSARTSLLLVGLCLSPASADDVRAFAATSETDTTSGVVASRDVLVMRTDASGTSLSIVSGDTASAPVPIAFAADGEIENATPGPTETCYNMAMAMDHAARGPGRVGVRPAVTLFFGVADRAVPVVLPLSVAARDDVVDAAGSGRTAVPVAGRSGAAVVNVTMTGSVESAGGRLSRASFVEVTSLASAARAVSRTTCSLASVVVPVAS